MHQTGSLFRTGQLHRLPPVNLENSCAGTPGKTRFCIAYQRRNAGLGNAFDLHPFIAIVVPDSAVLGSQQIIFAETDDVRKNRFLKLNRQSDERLLEWRPSAGSSGALHQRLFAIAFQKAEIREPAVLQPGCGQNRNHRKRWRICPDLGNRAEQPGVGISRSWRKVEKHDRIRINSRQKI